MAKYAFRIASHLLAFTFPTRSCLISTKKSVRNVAFTNRLELTLVVFSPGLALALA